ncbi:unnamed protein product [Moneuplotes crassus]|uniref:RING-type domain-containing protein n=1 Tax=Euplotes crassus TaxID=5936 RepID=A0AAD1XLT9_EUPCR|nr:unnamed protein product [Moneuplotes crassus]
MCCRFTSLLPKSRQAAPAASCMRELPNLFGAFQNKEGKFVKEKREVREQVVVVCREAEVREEDVGNKRLRLDEEGKEERWEVGKVTEILQDEIKAIIKDKEGLLASDGVCVLVACNHGFHKRCIQTWLEKNNSCPICRTETFKADKYEDSDDEDSLEENYTLAEAYRYYLDDSSSEDSFSYYDYDDAFDYDYDFF